MTCDKQRGMGCGEIWHSVAKVGGGQTYRKKCDIVYGQPLRHIILDVEDINGDLQNKNFKKQQLKYTHLTMSPVCHFIL